MEQVSGVGDAERQSERVHHLPQVQVTDAADMGAGFGATDHTGADARLADRLAPVDLFGEPRPRQRLAIAMRRQADALQEVAEIDGGEAESLVKAAGSAGADADESFVRETRFRDDGRGDFGAKHR